MTLSGKRLEGTLVSWDDARGFGFIEGPDLAQPVFLHAKFLRARHRRPAVGDRLSFSMGTGRDGGPAAADAEILGAPPPPPPRPHAATIVDVSRLMAATALLIGATIAYWIGAAPLWFPVLYLVMSFGSGVAYWLDKAFAREGRTRVRESMLHFADAFFGISGGLFAQHVFRHKTRKRSFRHVTRLIFLAHATLIAMVLGRMIVLGDISLR